jgi:small-conductance mechanosensitive channel
MPDWQRIQDQFAESVAEAGALLPQLLVAVAFFALWYFLAGWLRNGVRKAIQKVSDEGSARAISRLTRTLFLFLGFLIACSIGFPGFSFSALVTTLGLGSVAIGFAFKDIIENFLAGLILMISRPFRIGDVVEIQGRRGTITMIETRTTQIRMFDGEFVVMPNAILVKEPIVVVSKQPVRRLELRFNLALDSDLERAKEVAQAAIAAVGGVVQEPPPRAYLDRFGEALVEARIFFWVDTLESDMLEVRSQAVAALREALAKNEIEVPANLRNLLNPDRPR